MHPMDKDTIIYKWLNHELTEEELLTFNTSKDFEKERKIANALKQHAAPELESSAMLQSILNSPKQSSKKSILRPLLKIAALLVVGLGLSWYSLTLDTTIDTAIAEKQTITLPDASETVLNSKSSITYNDWNWKKERTVTLNGEAYFNVEKGSSFTVTTPHGEVTVLGTKFNVKNRDNIFKVTCYEGVVAVSYNSQQQKLYQGDTYLIINGNLIVTEKEKSQQPAWITDVSSFKSIPYTEVLKEFERQYNVTLELDPKIEPNTLFTGRFTHNNLDIALKSITLPLHISYSKTDKSIILKRD